LVRTTDLADELGWGARDPRTVDARGCADRTVPFGAGQPIGSVRCGCSPTYRPLRPAARRRDRGSVDIGEFVPSGGHAIGCAMPGRA